MEKHSPLFNTAYFKSLWAEDYEEFKASPEAGALHARLKNWAEREWQQETVSENAFIDAFFKQTWGYEAAGEGAREKGYSLYPQFPVKGAGQKGGVGKADIALGYFGRQDMDGVPQVLGEFKDDRSGLDKPQAGRPNVRSPVDQCLDYLREARTGLISSILPTWAMATDMNEFRLYYYGNKAQYQRFVIQAAEGDPAPSLINDSDESAFQRFLFYRIFHSRWLLTEGGKSRLEKILDDQIIHEQNLENEFYLEYRVFRETMYHTLMAHNPRYREESRLRRLVKYTQRILDRCIFILYCEDMGRELNFPPNILRDVLIEISAGKFYNPDADDAWSAVKRLYAAMRDGTPFGSERINRFNGGLFEEDPEMDALKIPNRIFCEQNQGQSSGRLLQYPKTLLYFSAKYNFGASGDDGGRTLTLTAMGRIFEQSITDLEVMEAHAEQRESLTELTRRKRDGVYYTPEWVTHYIVEETVGARLAEIREGLGFEKFTAVTDEQIGEYRKDRRKSKIVGEYVDALREYSERLNQLKVVDPACGSGAFLIQAFKHLYEQRQWLSRELQRVTGEADVFDTHTAMLDILSKNLYGVDINPESVEITRLALWLYTALPNCPLTSLDRNVRCGNSLIRPDFSLQINVNMDLFGEDEKDRINTFDWKEEFPEIFKKDDPGFDCVIGNPPYVKLQHFRRIQEDTANYLLNAGDRKGAPLYESTQTGNFDLYLPFIEQGVELLNRRGKMGYIAPNVWLVNEYGRGLRKKLKRTRRLERWIDFKSHQVFQEAITYTALQFFTGSENDGVRCVFAPEGKKDIMALDWRGVEDLVLYEDLADETGWVLMPNSERVLLSKLAKNFDKLGDEEITVKIFQGMVTSANNVYHLNKSKDGLYQKFGNEIKIVNNIENKYIRPLVTGHDAKRYQLPTISTYLLFPYDVSKNSSTLAPLGKIKELAPVTYTLLKDNERILRNREYPKMDRDDKWWGYVYPKNQCEQAKPKIMIASTATEIRAFVDQTGEYTPDDRRVYSVVPKKNDDIYYLMGLLNATLNTYLLKKWARPKANGYYDIETQFLAPLPIPKANEEEKALVAEKAKRLQELHTRRRDLLLMVDRRLASEQCEDDRRDESWFWADVKPMADIKKDGPPELKGAKLTAWAKSQRELKLAAHLEKIDPMLQPGIKLTVESEYGELKILAGGATVIEGVFLSGDESEFIAAQWRQKLRRTNVTEKFDGKKLVNQLLKLRKTGNSAIKEQVLRIDADIQALDAEIAPAETDMNRLTYRLYNLTDDEIRMVEKETGG